MSKLSINVNPTSGMIEVGIETPTKTYAVLITNNRLEAERVARIIESVIGTGKHEIGGEVWA